MGRDIVGFHRDQGASVRFLRELGYSQHQGLAALLHTGWDQAAAQRLLVNGVIFEVVATYWRARGRRRQRGPRPLLVFREQQGPLRLRPWRVSPWADRARTRSRSRRPLRRSFVGGEASPRCLRSRGVAGGTERVRSGRTVLGHLGPACPGPEGLPSLHGPNWRRGCRQPLGGWPAGWRSTKGSCGAL